jgi:hypothetical protein
MFKGVIAIAALAVTAVTLMVSIPIQSYLLAASNESSTTTNQPPSQSEEQKQKQQQQPAESTNTQPQTTTEKNVKPMPTRGPDFECTFNPNDEHCKPDAEGKCPAGFAHNSQNNCFPRGPCPTGYSRRDNDETGTCFPGPNVCPKGFHLGPKHTCIRTVVITKNVHTGGGGSSSSGSHSLSVKCFDQIKIAWLGKIQRGQNNAVDNIIDPCLGIP